MSGDSFGADSDSSDDYEDEDDLDLLAEDEEDDENGDEVGAEGNRIVGALPKGVLEYLARNIVDDPDGVFVEVSEGRGAEVELRLRVITEVDDLQPSQLHRVPECQEGSRTGIRR